METGGLILARTHRARAVFAALRVLGQRRVFRMAKQRLLNPTWSKPIGPNAGSDEITARTAHDEALRAKLRALPQETLFEYTRGLVNTYRAFWGRDLSSDVHRLSMPVHIIHGTEDTIVPFPKGRDLHQRIAGSEMHVLEGLGHGLLLYEPGREALRRVLDGYAMD
jgi:pimeloyl-ACP methyl ester carboxylesterase